jgi:hypothetical protein
MIKRILFTALLLVSIFTLPVWCTGVFVLLGILIFQTYSEAVFVVFLYEAVLAPFATPFPFIGTVVTFLVVCVVESIRPYVRK